MAVPRLLGWLGLAGLLAALLHWGMRSPAPDAASPLVVASQRHEPTGSLQASSLASRVLLGGDLADAEHQLSDLDAPLARELRREIQLACRVPVLLRLDGREEHDPRRGEALAVLRRRCRALPEPSLYDPGASLVAIEEEPPLDAGEALAALMAAGDEESLRSAWLLAFHSAALPLQQILADGRLLLPLEAEQLIDVVIDWRRCARHHACGGDSLITLRVCALHGCRPGSDLWAAWHDALSPRDFEAARSIHAWLQELIPVRSEGLQGRP